MYWKDIGYILTENTNISELHRPQIQYKRKKVYCNIKSIGQSEFYQAQVSGLKPEIKVEVKLQDIVENATHFEIKGKIYKILRTYKLQDKTEITLTSMVVNNE